ncbi:GIY-YIG nuclease family protein [Tsuneonella sp. HG222]
MDSRPDLPPERRHVEPAYDEVGPVRKARESFVYFVQAETGQIKIGLADNVDRRFAVLRSHSPVPLRLLATKQGNHEQEWFYHQIFHRHRLHGEWFDPHQSILDEIAAISQKAG